MVGLESRKHVVGYGVVMVRISPKRYWKGYNNNYNNNNYNNNNTAMRMSASRLSAD